MARSVAHGLGARELFEGFCKHTAIHEEEDAEQRQRHASQFLRYHSEPTPEHPNGEYADFHAMRHTRATELVLADVKPSTAHRELGHSSIKMTMDLYAKVREQHRHDELRAKLGKVAG